MDSNAFLNVENCRIRFITGEGEYEGVVSRFVPETQVLFVKSVIWLPKNTKMGTLTFRAHEIWSFEIISRSEAPKSLYSHVYAEKFYRDTQRYTLMDDEIDDSSSMHESEMYDDEEEKQYELKLPPMLSESLPLDNVVIDCLNQQFYDSIGHIKKQDVIGLSVESPKISRFEKLHWLCISTQSCTFLFDVQTLGKDAFSKGLKDILEDPRIVKVLHDCREACDCLYHQYDTKLVNVFDTQVADYVINQQRIRKGKHTKNVNSLNSCLACYLDVPDEFLYRRKKRSYHDDLVFFGLRPISDDFRDLFIKNVIYLRRLKQVVDLLLLEPFHRCVDVYLKSLQRKTNREFNLEAFRDNIVPDELLSEGIQVFRFKEHVGVPEVVSSGPPYLDNTNNRFKQYLNYCDNIQNGDGSKCYVRPLQRNSSVPVESFCVKRDSGLIRTDSCAVKQEVEPFGKESSSESSSLPTDSLEADSQKQNLADNSTTDKEDFDDPWVNFRKAFADTGPTMDGHKYVFVPA